MAAVVKLSAVWAMLQVCAEGWKVERRANNWCIIWKGKEYPSIPVGDPNVRDPEIKAGYIRHMVGTLKIPKDCVRKELPGALLR